MWLVVSPESLAELERLNAAHEDRKIEPVPCGDGTLLVSDDVIGDSYWADYSEWLSGLQPTHLTPAAGE